VLREAQGAGAFGDRQGGDQGGQFVLAGAAGAGVEVSP
jgi:hypothetical protein